MSTTTTTLAELPSFVGEELGTSDWTEVTQERVNLFADATGAATIERDGGDKPVCVAELVARFYG